MKTTYRHYPGIKDVPRKLSDGRYLAELRRAELRRLAMSLGVDPGGPETEKRELVYRIDAHMAGI